MTLGLKQRFSIYIHPIYFIFVFLSGFIGAILSCLLAFDLRSLMSLSRLRDLGFARAFSKMGPGFKRFEDTLAVPDLVASAYGTVLEIGAGIGSQCGRYDNAKIGQIFGIEPNGNMVPELRAAADLAGLGEKYHVVVCGAEDLEALKARGVEEGSVDCVLSVQVLCSVPQPKEVIAALYRLLKPGGEMIVFEHISCKDKGNRIAQRLWNPIWKFSLLGCSLDRQTDEWLIKVGKWEHVDLMWDKEEISLLPRVWGRLIKAKD